ncbi:hypothetical protein [Streptomyces fagopyri]|uniref:hypothetical protein n=1 Tax=Streptomyces fagopyri TaxID=2662397 RepID=UPI003827EE1A
MTTAVLERIGGFVAPRAVAHDEPPVAWAVDDAWVRGRGGTGERRRATPGARFGNRGTASLPLVPPDAAAGGEPRGGQRVPLTARGAAGPARGDGRAAVARARTVPRLDGVAAPEPGPAAPTA